MKTIANWQLPIKTASESNLKEHWSKSSKRHAVQKGWVKWAFNKDKPDLTDALVFRVLLTRIAPRKLDAHDNLRVSMKWVVDSIAEELTGNYIPGRADDAKTITWDYLQEKGKPHEYAVRIEIQAVA